MDDLQNWNTVDWSGMMMRVIDIEMYCAAISVPSLATESVTIQLEDEMCPWNRGIYRLTPIEGSLEIERLDDNMEPEVSLDAIRLSEVIGGLTPALTLRGLGKIDCTFEVAEKLENIFPADSFVSYQRF